MQKVVILSLLTVMLASARADVEVLWGVTGVAGASATLYAINPATGAIVGQRATGTTGLSGIAVHPITKVIYATDSNQGSGTRNLYRIDPFTGATTVIGELGFPVADTAFRADGVLYAWRPQTNRLYTINLTTATPTMLSGTPSTEGASGITFGPGGVFYMVRNNSLITLNISFGNLATGPFTLSGATMNVDNLFATNAAGTLYAGKRNLKSAPTTLYTISGAAVTTLAATINGLALSGMDFGLVAPPSSFKPSKKTVRVKSSTATLRGTARSPLTLRVTGKGKRATVKNGRWTLRVKVQPGRNVIKLRCADGMGQSAAAKVVVVRS